MDTIEAVCNAALDQIGYKRRIGSIYDGTPAARLALDVWGQTRDELLEALRPMWARKDAVLTVIRQAPADRYFSTAWNNTFPPLPWLYEYAFEADMVKPVQVKGPMFGVPQWRPRAVLWRENNDESGVNSILTNQPDAIATYVARILDVRVWHDDFTATLIDRLAQKLSSLVPEAASANEARRSGQQSS